MSKNHLSNEELASIHITLMDRVANNLKQLETDIEILLHNKEMFKADDKVLDRKIMNLLEMSIVNDKLVKLSSELFNAYRKKKLYN